MFRAALLSLAFVLPAAAQAQCNGPSFWDRLDDAQQNALVEQVVATPYGTGNLWTATKDGTTLTIVGTMHLPDPRHGTLFDLVERTLTSADLLLVEATLQDQSAMQTHMAQNPDLMAITNGPTLPELVDDPTWAAIRDAASARGVPGFMAAKMQPWFLSLTLAIPPCAMSAMVAGDAGLDNMLLVAAHARGVPTQALEPWQDMFALLSGGTFDEQIAALRISLIDPNLQDAMVVTLTDFYFAEQSAMAWYINDYTKDFLPPEAAATFDAQMADLEQRLLIDRNANWIPVIETAADTHDSIVVAFGAAHLFGDFGVLNLLDNAGWTVEPR